MLLLGLYIPDPAVLPTIWPSEILLGGMNDSISVYALFWVKFKGVDVVVFGLWCGFVSLMGGLFGCVCILLLLAMVLLGC